MFEGTLNSCMMGHFLVEIEAVRLMFFVCSLCLLCGIYVCSLCWLFLCAVCCCCGVVVVLLWCSCGVVVVVLVVGLCSSSLYHTHTRHQTLLKFAVVTDFTIYSTKLF